MNGPEGPSERHAHMGKGLLVGAIAGAGFWAANEFIPTTKSNMLDQLINVAAAAIVGAGAAHFLMHRK